MNLYIESSYGTIVIKNSKITLADIKNKFTYDVTITDNVIGEFYYKGDFTNSFNYIRNDASLIRVEVYKGYFNLNDSYFDKLYCLYELGHITVRLDGRDGYTFLLDIAGHYNEFNPYSIEKDGYTIYGDGKKFVQITNKYPYNTIFKYFDLED